jgi:hypothetical protein
MKKILIGMGAFLVVGITGTTLDNDWLFLAAIPAALATWSVLFFLAPTAHGAKRRRSDFTEVR